jgi:leader peptidase (prepilin peptidase) / N-methyltransferase
MSDIADLLRESAWAFTFVAGLFGLVVGSFLNVVIHRLPTMLMRRWRQDCDLLAADGDTPVERPTGERYDLIVPASHCPHCRTPIRFHQNVPLISYLALQGRCGSCGTPIPARYPLVEALTAGLSAVVAARFGYGAPALCALGITWTLIALAAIDFDTQYLPDELTLPLLWAGLLASVWIGRGHDALPVGPSSAILGATFGYLSLWTVFQGFRLTTGKEGMGYGDFKLLAALGAWGGWQLLLPIVLLAAVSGAVIGIGLIATGRHRRAAPMPFGPFLATAGWLVLVFPRQLVSPWWLFGP